MIPNATDIDIKSQINRQETITDIKVTDTFKYYETKAPLKTESNYMSDGNVEDMEKEVLTSEKILSSVKGVVLDIIDEKVKAKIDNKLIIFFPLKLFSDSEILQYGQQFIYQIVIDEKGYRTQKFIIDKAIVNSDDRNELLEKLKSI